MTSLVSVDAVPMDVSDSQHNDASHASHEQLSSTTSSNTDGLSVAEPLAAAVSAEAEHNQNIVTSDQDHHSSELSQRDNMDLIDSHPDPQPATGKEVVVPVAATGLF